MGDTRRILTAKILGVLQGLHASPDASLDPKPKDTMRVLKVKIARSRATLT